MNRKHVRLGLWIPLAITVVTVLAYLNAFANPFIFDDELIIVNNPEIRNLLPIVVRARWLVNVTFGINYATGQLRVADYHATNLLIHVLAALVLYGVVRRTLVLPRMGKCWKQHGTVLAGAVAALWAVHPLQTQSVTYICQRYESMMGLFYLFTLYAFIRGVQSAGKTGTNVWFCLSVLACLLGMQTKEIMVTAPLVVLLYDFLVFAESPGDVVRRRGAVHLGLWLTLAAFALLEWEMFRTVGEQGKGVTLAVPWHSYLMTQMQVIPHYLRLSILPYPLCFDYAWPFVRSWTESALPGALLVGLGLLTVGLALRRRPEAFLGIWFFCILAPTSSIVPVPDAAYEYRMYLPLAAVVSVAVLGGYQLLWRLKVGEREARMVSVAVLTVLLTVGVVMTRQRNGVYRSHQVLWADVVKTRPGNNRARLNLASTLLRIGQRDRAKQETRIVLDRLAHCARLQARDVPEWGKTAEEASLYRDARHYAIAHNYLGVAAMQQGNVAEAEAHFAEAARLLPQFEDATRNLRQARHSRQKEEPRRSGALR